MSEVLSNPVGGYEVVYKFAILNGAAHRAERNSAAFSERSRRSHLRRCDVNGNPADRVSNAVEGMGGWASRSRRAEADFKPGSAAASRKSAVVSDCRKIGPRDRKVRTAKVNASEPSMTHRKSKTLSEPRGAVHLRDKLGERSADRPSGSRC
jgi:hypothetical protein